MVDRKYIINFITKIIESGNSNTKGATKKLIVDFREYLILTKSLSSEDALGFSKVIECLDEILSLKDKTGQLIDIASLFKKDEKVKLSNFTFEVSEPKITSRVRERSYTPSVSYDYPHYRHYQEDTSSSCGSSSVSRSSC